MNRRIFNTSTVFGILGVLSSQSIFSGTLTENNTEKLTSLRDINGMILKLYKKQYATKDKDHSQYILTFDVFNQKSALTEGIYQLFDNNGKKHEIFMSPVNNQQLQAIFNHRTYA